MIEDTDGQIERTGLIEKYRLISDVDQLFKVWELLSDAYGEPLSSRVDFYEEYVRKVALNACNLVLLEKNDPIGCLSIYLNDVSSGQAFITQLMVRRNRQGMGVGTGLLKLSESLAKEKGFSSIALEVRSDNAGAKRLYKRMGYEELKATQRGWLLRKHL